MVVSRLIEGGSITDQNWLKASLFTLLGWALMFFRKDNKTLHDLLSATAVVNKK